MKNYKIKEYNAVPKITNQNCPFDVIVTPSGGSNYIVNFIRVGSVSPYGIPDNLISGETSLLSLTVQDDDYIKLHFTSNTQNVITDIQIIKEANPTEPIESTENNAPTDWKFDIFHIFNGSAVRLINCSSLSAVPYISFITSKEDYECGEDPIIRYYNWLVR